MALGPKWGKNGQKRRNNRKMTPNPIFSPFLGHFFPVSCRGPFSIFWPVFPHFWISARFPFYTRRPGLAIREGVCSEKLGKAGNCRFQKHPARKVGTRSRQCGPKVPGRFAFPGARNPRICSIWRSGKNFPAIFPEFSRNFPPGLPQRPQKQPQPSRVF